MFSAVARFAKCLEKYVTALTSKEKRGKGTWYLYICAIHFVSSLLQHGETYTTHAYPNSQLTNQETCYYPDILRYQVTGLIWLWYQGHLAESELVWFGRLVSFAFAVGILPRVNLIALPPLGQNCLRKIAMTLAILAQLCLAKVRTMTRPNSPDLPPNWPKRTKKVRFGTKKVRLGRNILPRIPFKGSPLNKSIPECSGAVSLKSIISADRLWLSYTIINPPPPIPVECMLMTPTHNVVAMAASTAEPPFLRMFRPTLEHSALSAATAACW